MVEPESGIKKIIIVLHSGLTIAWLSISTCVYGIITILLSLVNQRFAYQIVKLWAAQLLFSAGIRVRTNGMQKLIKGDQYIFIANHSSVFDIPALYVSLPFQIGFLAKKELFSIPLFGKILHSSGNICIDRSNARKARESIDKAVERLKSQKTSLALFPEGTRSKDGKIGTFRSASFALVLGAGIKIVPILISGTFNILKKNSLLVKPGIVDCEIADPIQEESIKDLSRNELSQKIREILVEMQMQRKS